MFRLAVPDFPEGAAVNLPAADGDIRLTVADGFVTSDNREELVTVREVFEIRTDIEDTAAPVVSATPATAAAAETAGIDLSKVEGSGASGRVTVSDVAAATPHEDK